MEINETKIIEKCRQGHLEEFGSLYDRYIKKIYDFIYYKTHHKETAEDLCSQVFMKAISKIKGFNLDKGTFQAWIYAIARNTVIDYYRTKKNEIDIFDIWDLAVKENVERDIDTKIKLEKVVLYLKELKQKQRDIIIMRVWQGLGYREIAEILNKSEASCKMSYSRAINKLRQEMPLSLYIAFLLLN
ncbi:hypothetical protein DRH27_05335 [Candidatus Falkowbacteria bacterium]|nr:MAG: hypothetical protein DRH27_05335 [Candidatus Falkowbacteria bacterium]